MNKFCYGLFTNTHTHTHTHTHMYRSKGWLSRVCLFCWELYWQLVLGLGIRYCRKETCSTDWNVWNHRFRDFFCLQSELCMGSGCTFPLGGLEWKYWSRKDLYFRRTCIKQLCVAELNIYIPFRSVMIPIRPGALHWWGYQEELDNYW